MEDKKGKKGEGKGSKKEGKEGDKAHAGAEAAEEKAAMLALLLIPGMDNRILRRLCLHHGSALKAWEKLEETPRALLGGAGAGERKEEWLRARRLLRPREELEKLQERGVRLLLRGEEGYPPDLGRIYDPPAVLFVRGSARPAGRLLAVVGSRKASAQGRHTAEALGREMAAAGIGVVSGGAFGIDAAAHRGALEVGGPTFAVLGHGFDHSYPPEHRGLFRRVEEAGCLVTEYPPAVPPSPWRFPERNRIIAGMCSGVVVVEGGEKSGALITADYAMEEGREVMAVPGSVSNPLTRGPHRLIRQGAGLVTCLEEILEELGWEGECGRAARAAEEVSPDPLSQSELSLLALLDGEPRSLDFLASRFPGPGPDLYLALSSLLVKGFLGEEPGGRYIRIEQ